MTAPSVHDTNVPRPALSGRAAEELGAVPRPVSSGRASAGRAHGGARPAVARALRSRTGCRGNALLEFVLTLPIIFFLTGLTMYLSFGMLSKQKALVDARRALWRSAGHGQWTEMRLEGHTPGLVEDDGTNRPRGTGEELDRLRPDVEPRTIVKTTNPRAQDYWYRIWDNLPGRHEAHASRSFADRVPGSMWGFLRKDTRAEHWRDTSPWHFHHLDAWKIARSGPLREIFQAFRDNLETARFAPHFEPTRDDVMNRWWHGDPFEDESTQ